MAQIHVLEGQLSINIRRIFLCFGLLIASSLCRADEVTGIPETETEKQSVEESTGKVVVEETQPFMNPSEATGTDMTEAQSKEGVQSAEQVISHEEIIDQYVARAARRLPLVLDDLVRLERVSRAGTSTLQFDFVMTGVDRSDMDEAFVRFILSQLANAVCENHAAFISGGIGIHYRYAMKGKPLGEMLLDSEACLRMPLSPDDPAISVSDPAPPPKDRAERLKRYVNRDSVGLPQMVEENIRLDRVSQSDEETLSYDFSMLGIKRAESSDKTVRLKMISVARDICRKFAPLLGEGGKVHYRFSLDDGLAGEIRADYSVCERIPLRVDDPVLSTVNIPAELADLDELIDDHVKDVSVGLPQTVTEVLRLDRISRVGKRMIRHEVTVVSEDEMAASSHFLRPIMLGMASQGCRAYEQFIAAGVKVKVDYTVEGTHKATLLLDQATCNRIPFAIDDPAAVVFN